MRKSTDICLLCKSDFSTRTNSHILPRFLSNQFLGPKANKKGFQITSSKSIKQSPQIIQDSPKEDYILCDGCEKYFSILETISSSTFTQWKDKVKSEDFILNQVIENFSIVECNNCDKATIRLFLYSIFWRVSISNHTVFRDLKIEFGWEEELRGILLKYKTDKQKTYYDLLDQDSTFSIFPIAIITAESFKDTTSNILCAPPFEGAYKLIADQFSFLLFKTFDEIPVDFFRVTSNITVDDCKIIVFSQEYWEYTIIQPIMDQLAQLMVNHKK